MDIKVYLRDGRSPIPKNKVTSKVMSANKGKNTKPEILLRKELWRRGLKGYRLHLKNIPGRPDIVFTRKKIAIFVNGCFWHRCPTCNLPLPKTNTVFWEKKFSTNVERDKRKKEQLEKLGWKVIIIWECMIKNDIFEAINLIKENLENQRK